MRSLSLLCSLFFALGAAFAQEIPVATIHTSWAPETESTIYFSVEYDDADADAVFLDCGYGKISPAETDENGEYRAKGNLIKVYGKIKGLVTPGEITLGVDFAENNHIKNVAISMTGLSAQVDLTPCKGLEYVSFMACGLNSFDFSLLPTSIEELFVMYNDFSEFVVDGLPNLKSLATGSCPNLAKVDVTRASALEKLDVSELPKLVSIDLSKNPKLSVLTAYNCGLTSVDLTATDNLKDITLTNNPDLMELKLGNTDNLMILSLGETQLSCPDLKKMPELLWLNLRKNPRITEVDLSANTELGIISLDSTNITSIDVKHLKYLEQLDLSGTRLTSLDVSGLEMLSLLSVEKCYSVSDLNIAGCTSMNGLLVDGNKFGFEMSKKMAEDLPESEEQGFVGFYRMDDPREENLMHVEDVEVIINKNFEVLQMNDTGEVSAYEGIPSAVEEVLTDGKDLKVFDHGDALKVALPEGCTSPLVVYTLAGEKIFFRQVKGDFVLIDKRELGRGKFVAACGTHSKVFVL